MGSERDVRDVGPVEVALHATLVPAGLDDKLVAASVGPDGEAIVLWSAADGAEAMRSRTGRPVGARVITYYPLPGHEVVIRDLGIAFPEVQPLPGDRTLIVGARCRWYSKGPERNAIVVDADGLPVAEGTLGDGIQEVLTTPSGLIWVGYFDEGVLGNYGWGGPGPDPIGSPGIVRFTPDLRVDWRYPYNAEGGSIIDAYALNVSGETAWSSYYTDFPIVRIKSGSITTWRGGVRGVQALIIGEGRCALIGGYGADQSRILIGFLTAEGFVPESTGVLTLPGGAELGRCRIVGRGAELHVFVGNRWFKTTIADLPW